MITKESAALTTRIVELRGRGLDWRAIGREVGLSAMACIHRYRKARGVDERQRRKHAEALVARLEARLQAADLLAHHARKWSPHDGALAYALQAYEEAGK